MSHSSQSKRVAFITGGTSGIGAATARRLAAQGVSVVLSGRRTAEGEAIVEEIRKAGGNASFVRVDTSIESDIAEAIAFTLRTYGRLDYAFNNAGVEGEPGLTTDRQTIENYRQTFDVNVLGVLLSMKHEITALLKSGGGSIVNTSSVAGRIGMPGFGLYVASKHAVEGLTRSAALEFARQGIRVNAVAPGAVQTPMLDRFIGASRENNPQRDWLSNQHPVGRVGEVDEIAQAVVALLENTFTTGAVLAVDGGWTAQ